MRPPFWEVSLFSHSASELPMMIESIACFSDRAAMRRYVLETRVRFPAHQVIARYMTGRGRTVEQRKNKNKLDSPFPQSMPPAALPRVGQNYR